MTRRFLAIAFGVALALTATVALAGRNSSGTMSLTSVAGGYPYVSGQTISSSGVNSNLAEVVTELSDSLSRSGKGGMTAALRGTDGTAALPAYSFTSDTNTGIYRIGTDNIGIALGGTKKVDLSAGAAAFTDPTSFLGSTTTSGIARFPGGVSGSTTFNDPVTFASSITVSGFATFASSVTVPTPLASTDAANKSYADGSTFEAEYVGTNWSAGANTTYFRQGRTVTVTFTYTAGGAAARADIVRLPAGYRPSVTVEFPGYWRSGGIYQPAIFQLSNSGSLMTFLSHDGSSLVGNTGTSGAGDIAAGTVTFYAAQ